GGQVDHVGPGQERASVRGVELSDRVSHASSNRDARCFAHVVESQHHAGVLARAMCRRAEDSEHTATAPVNTIAAIAPNIPSASSDAGAMKEVAEVSRTKRALLVSADRASPRT